MKQAFRALIVCLLMASASSCLQGQVSLGDVARQQRQQKEAARFGGVQLGTPAPLAAPGETIPIYFLRMSGKASDLTEIDLNGERITGGRLVTEHIADMLPQIVSPKVREGMNVLQVDYKSDPQEGLKVWVEERRRNAAPVIVGSYVGAAGEGAGESLKKLVPFQAHPRVAPPMALTDSDRDAIHQIITQYYAVLEKRDAAAATAFLTPALEDAKSIYPEVINWMSMADKFTAGMLQDKRFKMLPYEDAELQFSVAGSVVKVSRKDGQPIFASTKLEDDQSNAEAPKGTVKASKVSTQIAPTSLNFRKVNDRWCMALPYNY